jgi:hypothetical protein
MTALSVTGGAAYDAPRVELIEDHFIKNIWAFSNLITVCKGRGEASVLTYCQFPNSRTVAESAGPPTLHRAIRARRGVSLMPISDKSTLFSSSLPRRRTGL